MDPTGTNTTTELAQMHEKRIFYSKRTLGNLTKLLCIAMGHIFRAKDGLGVKLISYMSVVVKNLS